MAINKMKISWEDTLPDTGIAPNSIYFIKPTSGNKTQMFVSNKDGSQTYQVNPDVDLSSVIKTVNGLAGTSGNVALTISYDSNTHELSLSGQSAKINLSAYLVKLSDFNSFKSNVEGRLNTLEATLTEGLKTPKPFDASAQSSFPTQQKGFTYKVTVAGTVSGTKLEVGDTIIYDATGSAPFVIQSNVDSAQEGVKGLIMLASQSEVNTGSDSNKAVVPSTLQAKLNSLFATQEEVNAGSIDNKFVSPKTLLVKLQTLSNAAHTHTNLPVIEKFTESDGQLKFDGNVVYTLGTSAW